MTESRTAYSSRGSQAWVLRSRDLLQRSADDLDGESRSRLNRSRQAALAALDPVPASRSALRWVGVAAVVAGVALLSWRVLPTRIAAPTSAPVAAVPVRQPPPAVAPRVRSEPTPISAPDFELLADAQQFALVEELEFYAWLESAEDTDG